MLGTRLPSWSVLVDFDGTVAPDDPTDRLLERFADPAWRDVEAAWQGGEISSSECLARQVAMLRATPEALDEQIRSVRIDPGFPAFLEFCRRHGAEVKIVSDGFDRVLSAALRRARLSVPFFANKLEWQGGDRWRLAFPYAYGDCLVGSANCKCSHGQWPLLGPQVVIGDGRSDFCMSMRADYVLAKGTLADYCRTRGQAHAPFADFNDVTARLSMWLARAESASRAAPPLVLSPFPTAP
jgi:HAD superfamily phosphoserine phosphatase-like hydrolase